MKKASYLLVLAAAGLLLGACTGDQSSDSSNAGSSDPATSSTAPSVPSSDSSSPSDSSSGSSSSVAPVAKTWSDEDKALMEEYCGGVLPYPSGFVGNIQVEEIEDIYGGKYLQIVNRSKNNVIDDYYKDLEKASWKGTRDYSGNIEKTDGNGTSYYELVKTDANKGYNLVYFVDRSQVVHYNVIQCYNDFSNKLEERKWSDEEKAILDSCVTIIPPQIKLGDPNEVSAYGMDTVRCYDQCAIDATEENVAILKATGFAIDTKQSEENGVYVLYKTVNEEERIEAYIFYNSGNFVVFNYAYTIKTSTTWPSEATAAFKAKTGFEIPAFADEYGSIEQYSYYTKAGVTTIMAKADWYAGDYLTRDLTDKGLVYYRESLLSADLYTDWAETFYVSPFTVRDEEYNDILCVSFGELEEKIHDFTTGWPSEMVDGFLTKNNIGVSCPTIDYSLLGSTEDTTRYEVVNYEDIYPTWLKNVQDNPTGYGLKETASQEEIKAKAEEKAKENSYIKVSIRDPEIRIDDNNTTYNVDVYLENMMKNLGWSRTDGIIGDTDYDIAYEDPTGEFLFATDLVNGKEGICTVTITYGSGKTHTPTLAFPTKKMTLAAGDTANLWLKVDMLPYTVTYTSSNSAVTVDENGCVTVSQEAVAGTIATITASVTDPSGKEYSDTCEITITKNYDVESAINDVAVAYNEYFGYAEDADSAAKPEMVSISDVDEGTFVTYYTFTVNPTVSETELKTLVASKLIPLGFTHDGDITWSAGEFDDGIANKWVGFTWTNKYGEGVDLMFYIYKDASGNLALRVMTFSL